jgi:hypothetical protein
MCDEIAYPYRETRRTSRKERRCSECLRPIDKGEQYIDVGAMWDHRWYSYDFCLFCQALREVLAEEWDECIPLGGLDDLIADCIDLEEADIPLLLTFFPNIRPESWWAEVVARQHRPFFPLSLEDVARQEREMAEQRRFEHMARTMGGEP